MEVRERIREQDKQYLIRQQYKNHTHIKNEFDELKKHYEGFENKFPDIVILNPDKTEYEKLFKHKHKLGYFLDDKCTWRHRNDYKYD